MNILENLRNTITNKVLENLTIDSLLTHLSTLGFTADIDFVSRQAKSYQPPIINFGNGRIIADHGVNDSGEVMLRFSLIEDGYSVGEPVKGEDRELAEPILYFRFTNKESAKVLVSWSVSVCKLFDKIAVDFERDEYKGISTEC